MGMQVLVDMFGMGWGSGSWKEVSENPVYAEYSQSDLIQAFKYDSSLVWY